MNESQKFINFETLGARILLGATILALCLSNSPWGGLYDSFFHTDMLIQFGQLNLKFNFLDLINEGLMAVFFLVVGLEIKYELLKGALNSRKKAALPVIGAIGGMLVPALIYIAINYHHSILLRGWAVPTATDIAFALSVISLLSRKVPSALKVFLTALAIIDDLAAIIIIAVFYTAHLSFIFLLLAMLCVLLLLILNRLGVMQLPIYLATGIVLWVCLLKSGIHATLSGVILAFMIPIQHKEKKHISPLKNLQDKLHPWVALLIIPLFALSNAGVSFLHLGTKDLQWSIILGTLFGLFLGKQLGIFSFSWLAIKLKAAMLPDHVLWKEFYAITIVCGIGFTISLFIGSLAFSYQSITYLNSVKIGVFLGSIFSGTMGYLLLLFIHRKRMLSH